MLDPFTALSLAGNIVQFVDFGSKIISESVKIYKSGSAVETKELEVITNDLIDLSAKIQQSIRPAVGPVTSLSNDDTRLEALAKESTGVASELIEALNKLKVNTRSRVWNSVGQALKTAMGKEKIHEIARRLASFRDELQLRILVSLKASLDVTNIHNDVRYDHVDQELKQLMDDILSGKVEILDRIDERTAIIIARQEQSDMLSIQHHEKVMAAISALATTPDVLYTARPVETTAHVHPPEIAAAAKKSVLEQLAFRGMRDREDSVMREYDHTFEWALRDLSNAETPGSTLIDWLRRGDGCYWINGKAASGKSTLMKFLMRRPEVRAALKQWAGTKHLFMDSFFFWNVGTVLQKSQLGLLRSLLHSMLDRYQDMIPSVLHGYYTEWATAHAHRASGASNPDPITQLSETEIKIAFLRTVEYLPPGVKVCIFIDGIDEYDGDHSEISALLKSVARGNLKMVLSSRPIRACQIAFEGLPTLRVQDLSRGDIELYVNAQINQHGRMRELRLEEPGRADDLVDEIVAKASGVFLWVMLVVKSLLRGLDNSDRVDDLRRRLEQFPPELEGLYRHMMDRMDPLYRQQASKYLQIVLRSAEVQEEEPLSLLQMSLADDADASVSLDLTSPSLSGSYIAAKAKAAEARLVSRCFGLIEADGIAPVSMVTFLHKSVADFLHQPDVWTYMVELTAPLQFDANYSLAKSCLGVAKLVPVLVGWWNPSLMSVEALKQLVSDFIAYCRLFKQSTGRSYTTYYDELADAMETVLPGLNVGRSKSRPSNAPVSISWAFDLGLLQRDRLFYGHLPKFLIPAVFGLVSYLDERLNGITNLDEIDPGLLFEVIGLQYFHKAYNRRSSAVFEEAISCILDHGADPNCVWRTIRSPWVGLLAVPTQILPEATGHLSIIESWVRVVLLFVKHGANPNLVLRRSIDEPAVDRSQPPCDKMTVLALIQDYKLDFCALPSKYPDPCGLPAQWDELENALIWKGAKAQRWYKGKPTTDETLNPYRETWMFQSISKMLTAFQYESLHQA